MKAELVHKFVNSLSLLEVKQLQEIATKRVQMLQYAAIGRGSVVSFLDRAGGTHLMKVDRINDKTFGGTEVGSKRTWRVSKLLCTPVEDYRPPVPAAARKPSEPYTSSSGVSW